MAKLNIRDASYNGIKGAKKIERITNDEYDKLSLEADERIRENHLKQARTYKEAESYFCRMYR